MTIGTVGGEFDFLQSLLAYRHDKLALYHGFEMILAICGLTAEMFLFRGMELRVDVV